MELLLAWAMVCLTVVSMAMCIVASVWKDKYNL